MVRSAKHLLRHFPFLLCSKKSAEMAPITEVGNLGESSSLLALALALCCVVDALPAVHVLPLARFENASQGSQVLPWSLQFD